MKTPIIKYLLKITFAFPLMVIPCSVAFSQETGPKVVREIFVPEAEIAKLLDGCTDRILLDREEFESLRKEALEIESEKARKLEARHGEAPAPVPWVILATNYEVNVVDERAWIRGTLQWEIFEEDLVAIPLNLGNMTLRSARLDESAARIGYEQPSDSNSAENRGPLKLFVEGKGKHTLAVEGVIPLRVDATKLNLDLRLPPGPVSELTLDIPGDVDLISGATSISRKIEGDGAESKTRFQLLHASETLNLTTTLNSHKTRAVRAVLARSVQFDEITEEYARVHATVSLDILFRPLESFRFKVPAGFEITDVRCERMNRWKMTDGVMEVEFREPVSGRTTIYISATKYKNDSLDEWTFAFFEPIDVDADAAIFGLLVDVALEVSKLRDGDALPIDASKLRDAIPPGVFETVPGAPAVRVVSAWYAPRGASEIAAAFVKKPDRFDVQTNLVLELRLQEPVLHGVFLVTPATEKIFNVLLESPAGWKPIRITDSENVSLVFDPVEPPPDEEKNGTKCYKIRFPRGIARGATARILFEAKGDTTDWYGDWTEKTVPFPEFRLLGADRDRGTIAVNAEEDWSVVPTNLRRLTTLDDKEKRIALEGIVSRIALSYPEASYGFDLAIRKESPRITVKSRSFYRVTPSQWTARFELDYTIEEARVPSVSFLLPEEITETPKIELAGARPGFIAIKETAHESIDVDGRKMKRWTVWFDKPFRGTVPLVVDVQKSIPQGVTDKEETLEMPQIKADHVAWQSKLFAVEGHDELNVSVAPNQPVRPIDLGELTSVDPSFQARLLGAFRGPDHDAAIAVLVRRNPDYVLPAAIVQNVTAMSRPAEDGKRLDCFTYEFESKPVRIKVELTDDEELWGAELNGTTLRPQRAASAILIDFPGRTVFSPNRLKLTVGVRPVKDSASSPCPIGAVRNTELRVPALFLEENSSWNRVPVMCYDYRIEPPTGYKVVRCGDIAVSREVPRPVILDIGNGLGAFLSFFNPARIGCSAEKTAASRRDAPKELAKIPLPGDVEVAFDAASPHIFQPPEKSRDISGRPGMTPSRGAPVPQQGYPMYQQTTPVYKGKGLESIQPVTIRVSSVELTRSHYGIGTGEAKPLPVRMIKQSVLDTMTYTSCVAVFFLGLCFLRASAKGKAFLIFTIALIGTVGVLVPGWELYADAFNAMTLAALLGLFPLFAAVRFFRFISRIAKWVYSACRARFEFYIGNSSAKTNSETAVLLFLAVTLLAGTSFAASEPPRSDDAKEEAPIAVPRDAILIPYDPYVFYDEIPDPADLQSPLQRVLVPLKLYQAYKAVVGKETSDSPDGVKLPPIPARYSFAGARFTARLGETITDPPPQTEPAPPHIEPTPPHIEPAPPHVEPTPPTPEVPMESTPVSEEGIVTPEIVTPENVTPEDVAPGDENEVESTEIPVLDAAVLVEPGLAVEVPEEPVAMGTLDAPIPATRMVPVYHTTETESALLPCLGSALHHLLDSLGRGLCLPQILPAFQMNLQIVLLYQVLQDQVAQVSVAPAAEAREPGNNVGVDAEVTLEVYTDDPIVIPLTIEGAVVDSATLDGEPARLGLGAVLPASNPAAPAYLLRVHGKGTHELRLNLRFPIQKQGGFRLVQGRLPNIPAAAVSLIVEQPGTEIRSGTSSDQRKFDTKTANETIETVLADDGRFQWQWREKVDEGEIDLGLIATSEIVYDIQEDGLPFTWDLSLSLRRGRYESFRLRIPKDYLVCSVDGANVRGWNPVDGDAATNDTVSIDVELLKPTDADERISLALRKNVTFHGAAPLETRLPQVGVVGAAMHQGRILVRQGPLLDVKITPRSGVAQTDLPKETPTQDRSVSAFESPFGVRPLAAYRFTSDDYVVAVSAVLTPPDWTATTENVLRVSDFTSLLESRINIRAQKRAIYQFHVRLPGNFKIEKIEMPIPFESSREKQGDDLVLTILLADGLLGTARLTLIGELERPAAGEGLVSLLEMKEMPLPKVKVDNLYHSNQVYAVLLDPAFEVTYENRLNVVPTPRDRLDPELIPADQIGSLRLCLQPRLMKDDFDAVLRFTQKTTEVHCDTITNVCIGSQSLLETIMLDYRITGAGIRRVEFALPREFKEARISVPKMQYKKIVPLDAAADSPIGVQIELQEDLVGELKVLIENERPLVPDTSYPVPVPRIESATTDRQFVVFENQLGADELTVDVGKESVFKELRREGAEWNYLSSILGNGAIFAYVAHGSNYADVAKATDIAMKMRRRETVALSQASIGLAETVMILAAPGDYVVEQIYRIDNKTQQFLDVVLPENSRLWTARNYSTVAWKNRAGARHIDEISPQSFPVKPTVPESSEIQTYKKTSKIKGVDKADDSRFVRIPLMKTEIGDLDRVLQLVYSGKIDPLRPISRTGIPFVKVLNVPVESSVVRLTLPSEYRYQFDGTLQESRTDAAVHVQEDAYHQKVFGKLQAAAQSSNRFENVRANTNLGLMEQMEGKRGVTSRAMPSPGSSVATPPVPYVAPQQAAMPDVVDGSNNNNDSLRVNYARQTNPKARNVFSKSELLAPGILGGKSVTYSSGQGVQDDWIAKNSLVNPEATSESKKQEEVLARAPASQNQSFQFDGQQWNAPSTRNRIQSLNPQGQIVLGEDNLEAESADVFRDDKDSNRMDAEFAKNVRTRQAPVVSQPQMSDDNYVEREAAQMALESRGRTEAYSNSGVVPLPSLRPSSSLPGSARRSEEVGGGMMGGGMSGPGAMAGGLGMGGGMGGMGGSYGSTHRDTRAYQDSLANTVEQRADASGQYYTAPSSGDHSEMAMQSRLEAVGARQRGMTYNPPTPFNPPTSSPESAGMIAKRFTSLKIEFSPKLLDGGTTYQFTSPQGEMELSAQCFPNDWIKRGTLLAYGLGTWVLLWALYRCCLFLGNRLRSRRSIQRAV